MSQPDWIRFLAEVNAMRQEPVFAWCGCLDLLARAVRATQAVSEEQRQYLADVRRRTAEPEFAAEYARRPVTGGSPW